MNYSEQSDFLTAETAEVIDFLKAGKSVEVIGTRGSGWEDIESIPFRNANPHRIDNFCRAR